MSSTKPASLRPPVPREGDALLVHDQHLGLHESTNWTRQGQYIVLSGGRRFHVIDDWKSVRSGWITSPGGDLVQRMG
jgi:hypothetical protein